MSKPPPPGQIFKLRTERGSVGHAGFARRECFENLPARGKAAVNGPQSKHSAKLKVLGSRASVWSAVASAPLANGRKVPPVCWRAARTKAAEGRRTPRRWRESLQPGEREASWSAPSPLALWGGAVAEPGTEHGSVTRSNVASQSRCEIIWRPIKFEHCCGSQSRAPKKERFPAYAAPF
jgi:hypothetical protein